MSYDISLRDPVSGETLELDQPHHMRGGTYAVGGTTLAELNVTYNYSEHYRRLFSPRDAREGEDYAKDGIVDGIRVIYGMTGAESIPALRQVAGQLGNDIHDDYWRATEGNAKRALLQLIALAKMRPDGVWKGD